MDSLTLITKKYGGEDAAHPRFTAPLVRDSRSAVSRLPGLAPTNTFDLYSGSGDHRYRLEDYTIKIAANQHFLILSINIKITVPITVATRSNA
jgi:hypothetical protein